MARLECDKFWLQAKYQRIKKKRYPSILLATLLKRWIEIWQTFLKFSQILAIENLKKALDFTTFKFLI
jgi:hypothetical protein